MGGRIGVCVNRHDCVWVSATKNRVQQFTNDAKILHEVGDEVIESGQFYRPLGSGLGCRDFLYVANPKNGRIQNFVSACQAMTEDARPRRSWAAMMQ